MSLLNLFFISDADNRKRFEAVPLLNLALKTFLSGIQESFEAALETSVIK